jgi:hypothetical protein
VGSSAGLAGVEKSKFFIPPDSPSPARSQWFKWQHLIIPCFSQHSHQLILYREKWNNYYRIVYWKTVVPTGTPSLYLFGRTEESHAKYLLAWPVYGPTNKAKIYKKIPVTAIRNNKPIVSSNPIRGMVVCIYSVCIALCVDRGFAMGWSPVQGVLSTVYSMQKLEKRRAANDQQSIVEP